MSDWSHEAKTPLEDIRELGEAFGRQQFGPSSMRNCMACHSRVDVRDAVYVRGLPFCTAHCAERYPEVYEALAGAPDSTFFGGVTE